MIGLFDYDLYKKREKYFLPNIYLMKCYTYYNFFTTVKMMYSVENWDKYQIVYVFSENQYLNKQDLPNNSNIKFIGSGFYKNDLAVINFINNEPSWEPYSKWLETALRYDFLTPFQVRKYTDASHILFTFEKNNVFFETFVEKNFYKNKRFIVIHDRQFFNLMNSSKHFSQFDDFVGDIYFYHKQDLRLLKNKDIELIKKYQPKITIEVKTNYNAENYLETLLKLNEYNFVEIELVEHEISRYDSEKLWEERIKQLVNTAWFLANNDIKFSYNLPFDYDVSPFKTIEKIIRLWNYQRINDRTFSILEGIANYYYAKDKKAVNKLCRKGISGRDTPKYYSAMLGLLNNYFGIFFPTFVKKPMYYKKEGNNLTGLERKTKIEEIDKKLREVILSNSNKGVLSEEIQIYSTELQEYINGCDHTFSNNESALDSNGICGICKKYIDNNQKEKK